MSKLRSQRPRGAGPDDADPRMLLVLDLDETLIHATEVSTARPPDHVVFGYGVYRRPGLDLFLDHIASVFRVAVWTSSSLDYAEQVCASIFPDPANLDFLWARDRCTVRHDWERQASCYAKRLRKLRRYGYDLNRVLVVDDSPEKHTHNYGNLVRIAPFIGDPADSELAHLARYLSHLSMQPNVRCIEKRGWRAAWAIDAAR